jgi:hypothetical protein
MQGVMVRAVMLMAALCRCHHPPRRHALLVVLQWRRCSSLPLVEEAEAVVVAVVEVFPLAGAGFSRP